MKPHPASSVQHTDADSSRAEQEAVSPGFHKRLNGGGQDQDGDLCVGIPITSLTGRFQLLHAGNSEDGEDYNLGTFTGVSRFLSFAQKRRGRLVKPLI